MNPAENPSSTLEKARVLEHVLASSPPDLVVAFGTAGSRQGITANGSVVVGRRTFIHDPRAATPNPKYWIPARAAVVLDSGFPEASLRALDEQARYAAEARFVPPPINPAHPLLCLVGNGFISIGVVNITDYDDYSWADREAVSAFHRLGVGGQVGAIETTHGVIRSMSEAPFVHVSGIADAQGLFDLEVTPRAYAQNQAAAHNAGVTLAWLLPEMIRLL